MTSTAINARDAVSRSVAHSEKSKGELYAVNHEEGLPDSSSDDSLKPIYDNTHRKLKSRHIQLIGIGGSASLLIDPGIERLMALYRTIGTALFVQIG